VGNIQHVVSFQMAQMYRSQYKITKSGLKKQRLVLCPKNIT
jgi:hypothetical protein